MRKLVLLVLVIAVVAALPSLLGSKDPIGDVSGMLGLGEVERAKATVLRVRDGDTIRVRIDKTGVEEEVRVLGIDTPEVRENAECVFEDDPFDRVDAYRRAEQKARKGDTGLWAACWR